MKTRGPRDSGTPGLERLNPAQRAAAELALTAKRPVLIYGPPGTGKTTVIASVVEELVRRGQRVLLAAGTNTAVDNLLILLDERGVDFLRLGHLRREGPLRRHARNPLDTRIEYSLGQSEPSLDRLALRLRTVPVVAGTAHRCISAPAIEVISAAAPGPPFDVAIVDEASQITEPLTLGPLLLARRFVLVGDDRQLPPVISSDEARSAYVVPDLSQPARAMNLRGLDFTLFERLGGRAREARLEIQYRMSTEVQSLSNRLYYAGRLVAHDGVAGRRLSLRQDALASCSDEIQRRLDPDKPVVWETLVSPSATDRRNPAEAEAIAETIAWLLKASATPEKAAADVGVISPFRAQCHAVRAALGESLGESLARQVEVDTVERFQGREKEVMLLSLVVSTWSDFVMDDRRLNVAFTRARSKLIVFGPAQLLYRFESAAHRA